MTIDRSFIERNFASTERIRKMGQLTEVQLGTRVGQDWTVAIVLAHLAFWDRRSIFVLDVSEKAGKLVTPQIDVVVNDILLPEWAAIPPYEAARIALESAEAVDRRLEAYPASLLEEVYVYNKRWVFRALHRNEHLDEAEAALGNLPGK